jgi:hypothetical protein
LDEVLEDVGLALRPNPCTGDVLQLNTLLLPVDVVLVDVEGVLEGYVVLNHLRFIVVDVIRLHAGDTAQEFRGSLR